jgi:hypothetical protein
MQGIKSRSILAQLYNPSRGRSVLTKRSIVFAGHFTDQNRPWEITSQLLSVVQAQARVFDTIRKLLTLEVLPQFVRAKSG